ncbi:hypothetical protein ACP70R_042172 [Stipagrostis hirtigluma subsp. patula]
MAADDSDDERTKIPYLAMVRYTVVTVVSALAVVVVVMVTTVALRPENIRLSVLHRHVQANALWQQNVTIMASLGSGHRINSAAYTMDGHAGGVEVEESPAAASAETTVIGTEYKPAKEVELQFILRAYNPSGRVEIDCDNITVRVIDMPNWPDSFRGMVEIGKSDLLRLEPFTLTQQNSRTLMRPAIFNDTEVLSYLAATYGGRSSFTAMLEVNASISSSVFKLNNGSPPGRVVTHYCWPVTVATYNPRPYAKEASCTLLEEMNFAVDFRPASTGGDNLMLANP